MNLSSLIRNGTKALKQNSPELLTGIAVAGVAITGYLTAKVTFKAAKVIHEDHYNNARENDPLPVKEKAKLVWKLYIPPVLAGATTIACVIGASKTHQNRTAAAITAYTLGEKAFSEYKEQVLEDFGKGKGQKVRDEVVEKEVMKNPPKEVFVFNGDEVLCCDLTTMRYFKSNMEKLRRAQNEVNALAMRDRYVTIDEFYDQLEVWHGQAPLQLGWDSDRLMELEFTSVLTPDNQPCLAFKFNYIKPI